MTVPAEFTQILCNGLLITKQRNQPSLTSARTRSNCTGDALPGSLQYQLQLGDGEEFKAVTLWFLWNLSAKSSFRNVSFGLSQVRRWKRQIPKSCYQPCQGLLQGPAASTEDTCRHCSITSSPSARKPLGLIFSQITLRTGRDECEVGKLSLQVVAFVPRHGFMPHHLRHLTVYLLKGKKTTHQRQLGRRIWSTGPCWEAGNPAAVCHCTASSITGQ